MPRYIVSINTTEAADLALTGGKGTNLAKLSQLANITVPEGFVITTEAYKAFIKQFAGDKNTIRTLVTPRAFDAELSELLTANGERGLYAVRSSATAEDLPDASFAGQQDSFLNVQGFENIRQAVLDCFASLFNERALSYRNKNRFDNNTVSMAVIVQKMVQADFSGVMFTADPMTSDLFTTVIEAIAGLGEDFVSGRKTPATYKIRGGKVDAKGSELLTKELLNTLASVGKTIEKAYGAPQDIEWCIEDGKIYVVQSRPITTLYPLPQTGDELKRVYMSFGHQQMMTDVILPLGMSFLRFLFGMIDLLEIGGRPYVEFTYDIKNPFNRFMMRQKYGLMDEHTLAALDDVFSRKDYIKSTPRGVTMMNKAMKMNVPFIGFFKEAFRMNFNRSIDCIPEYFDRQWKSVSDFEAKLRGLKGVDALDLIELDSNKFDFLYDLTAMGATILIAYSIQKHINKYGLKLLGEDNYINKLAKSVNNNITSEMGLALGDVADVFRDTPPAFAYLEQSGENFSLDELREINRTSATAFDKFLQVWDALFGRN